LDLAKSPDVLPVIRQKRITAIVNCGAYTAVDRAESEPDLANAVNAVAPGLLATAAHSASIPIIHVSTDYVFSGEKSGAWNERDPIAPKSVYGRTKADGEMAIRSSGARHAIIRTAWVVSADGNNFIKTMLRLAQHHDVIRVVADQHGTPTHAGDLASAISKVTTALVQSVAQPSGTWHCTNRGATSWHGLATRTFSAAERLGLRVPSRLDPIRTEEYPTAARRPVNSVLDTSMIERDFGIQMRPWEGAVDEIVTQISREAD
jgi:dTDP-4-dehydrorhamnose reductase